MSNAYPLRVRLYGGRAIHAARDLTHSPGTETACQYYIDLAAENTWHDDTPVTCRRCLHALKKEANR